MGKLIDLTGKRFGRLTVLEKDSSGHNKPTIWTCKCDCGKITKVDGHDLKRGKTKSCGCINLKHGLKNTRIYNLWSKMKQRCYNVNSSNYKNYGERGITICNKWLDKDNGFINFYNWSMNNGYKDNLTIDRINVNGNYEPNNCRWITNIEQQRNKRNTRYATINNITKPVKEWCEILGIKYTTLLNWLNKGKKIIVSSDGKVHLE